MLYGKSTGAYEKGRFGMHWGLRKKSDLLDLYNDLCTKLAEAPFGPFDSLSLLVGERNARLIGKNASISFRPQVPVSSSQASHRHHIDHMEVDERVDE
jgi:hypothetical protein